MRQTGMYLMIFGGGSMALNFFGYEFSLLMWIDNWGTDLGWGIRGGALVVGAIIWFIGYRSENSNSESENSNSESENSVSESDNSAIRETADL